MLETAGTTGSPDADLRAVTPPLVVVLVDGDHHDQHLPAVPAGAEVIAADGGASLADLLGLRLDVVIGDLDSIDPVVLERARAAGVEVERHPVDKDRTDLDLALGRALASGTARIDVIGGAGGRRSHDLANLNLVASARWCAVELRWWCGSALMIPVHRTLELDVDPGTLVNLVPVAGDAVGVTTAGLRWPLRGETLPLGTTRGVSNVADRSRIGVHVDGGVVALVIDDARSVRS